MQKSFEYNGQTGIYIDSGKGYPLILVHGFCEDMSIWDHLIPYFEKSYRVITVDLPGSGRTPLQQQIETIDDMAEFVNQLLIHENIDDCVMIGHSMGGYVSLGFAEHHGGLLSGLGLLHSNPRLTYPPMFCPTALTTPSFITNVPFS